MELFIIITLLVLLAEVTYLTANATRKPLTRRQPHPVFVDTSVLIDGRIIAVAESGFISSELRIPRSVIGELQFLADHADNEKRARARHGLDVVSELQHIDGLNISIFQDGSKAEEGVDERLLKLAKRYNGSICTIDYNLNKVAVVEGIKVLNVNELTKSLRMAYLPGEKMMLELTQKGNDSHQAVGHLSDGTMVVVEHASKFIGQTIEIEFIRSLQTAAGKMMFAKRVEAAPPVVPAPKNEGRKPVVRRQSRSDDQPQQTVVSQQTKAAKKQPRRSSSRRPTSKDNEASLIDLVNNQ